MTNLPDQSRQGFFYCHDSVERVSQWSSVLWYDPWRWAKQWRQIPITNSLECGGYIRVTSRHSSVIVSFSILRHKAKMTRNFFHSGRVVCFVGHLPVLHVVGMFCITIFSSRDHGSHGWWGCGEWWRFVPSAHGVVVGVIVSEFTGSWYIFLEVQAMEWRGKMCWRSGYLLEGRVGIRMWSSNYWDRWSQRSNDTSTVDF